MVEFWALMVGIGAVVFFIGRAIARRLFKPKAALVVLGGACTLVALTSGEIGIAFGLAAVCCVIDLLVSTKPV
jgi:Na+-translocating ferredoxin:NAD+ oxidoreductase RnfE subunit